MKKIIVLFSIYLFVSFSSNAQADSTARIISFNANTVYFLNGLLLNVEDNDLKDLTRKWYKQFNVSSPPASNSTVTVQTDAETVYKLSYAIRQFPFRLIGNQWNEISTAINNSSAGYQPLIDRLTKLDNVDANDRTAIRQAGKKDAQGKL